MFFPKISTFFFNTTFSCCETSPLHKDQQFYNLPFVDLLVWPWRFVAPDKNCRLTEPGICFVRPVSRVGAAFVDLGSQKAQRKPK